MTLVRLDELTPITMVHAPLQWGCVHPQVPPSNAKVVTAEVVTMGAVGGSSSLSWLSSIWAGQIVFGGNK